MSRQILKLVNGVPRMSDMCEEVILTSPDSTKHLLKVANDGSLITDTVISDPYDETLVIGPGGVTAGTPISLPNGGEYLSGSDLSITINGGSALVFGTDYQEYGDCILTQVVFTFNLLENDQVRFVRL